MKHKRYRRKSGLYQELVQTLGNVCMICGREERLVIDHNHQTGAVRGLLCYTHNTGLGMFQDSPDLLRSAVNYLETHGYMKVPQPQKDKRALLRQRIVEILLDESFKTDAERAKQLAHESVMSMETAQVRLSRARKKL